MKLLIDGDSIVYKAAGAAQKKNAETGELDLSPVSHALSNAKTMLNRILAHAESNDYIIYLTATNDPNCFRKKMYPEYKANRAKTKRPYYYQDVRDYLVNHWNAVVVTEIEADDKVCMDQYILHGHMFLNNEMDALIKLYNNEPVSVIIGIDKDLDQIPGPHYNYDKDHAYYITPIQGFKNLCKQILAGDRADNIPRIYPRWVCTDTFTAIDKAHTFKEVWYIVNQAVHEIHDKQKEHILGLILSSSGWEVMYWDLYREMLVHKDIYDRANLLFLRRFEEDTFEKFLEEVLNERD